MLKKLLTLFLFLAKQMSTNFKELIKIILLKRIIQGLFKKNNPDNIEKELLQDAKEWEQKRSKKEKTIDKNSDQVIPMAKQNEELTFKEDLISRPEISTLKDYENIPVEGFGMAMLKGMGFKKEDGIGNINKAVVKCIEPSVRPKGMGLGVENVYKKASEYINSNRQELLKLVKGTCVFVEKEANNKNPDAYGTRYGQVEGLDEENARVLVKMAIGSKIFSLPESRLRIVSKSEFKELAISNNKGHYHCP